VIALKRVFLAGTTTGTTWRAELIERLVARGVHPDKIVNPHLPAGVHYTREHREAERACKHDPDTIVLVYICPAVVEDPTLDEETAAFKRELLGPISIWESCKFSYTQPHRTAVVFGISLFRPRKRPRGNLEDFARDLIEDFGGGPPYFATLAEAEDWIVTQLTA
jgi:hypothetical protein